MTTVPEPKKHLWRSWAATYCLSASAACFAETVTFPLDVIKSHLQKSGEIGAHGAATRATTVAKEIALREGASGFYQGLAPACLRHVFFSGSRVVLYHGMRDRIMGGMDENGHLPLWKGILCGMSAGFIAQLIASPTDLVKVTMQLERSKERPRFKGTAAAVKVLYHEGGILGMWRGWGPNCSRAAFVQLGDLTTYDAAKRKIKQLGIAEEGPVLHSMSSACAGLVAATLGTPFDVAKTRFMSQPVDPVSGKGMLYSSSFDCFSKTVRHEGFLALYKGWLTTWMRMAPWSLSFFLAFEQLSIAVGGVSRFG